MMDKREAVLMERLKVQVWGLPEIVCVRPQDRKSLGRMIYRMGNM